MSKMHFFVLRTLKMLHDISMAGILQKNPAINLVFIKLMNRYYTPI